MSSGSPNVVAALVNKVNKSLFIKDLILELGLRMPVQVCGGFHFECDFIFFPPGQHKELTGILILKYVLKLFFALKLQREIINANEILLLLTKIRMTLNEILIMFKNIIGILLIIINDYGYDFNVFRFA